MNKIFRIIISMGLEVILMLVTIAVFAFVGANFFPNSDRKPAVFAFFGLIVFSIYLLFSNTKYRSISSLLLRYKFEVEGFKYIKIIISNIVLYGSLIGFIGLRTVENLYIAYRLLQLIYFLEIVTCFIPKIGTRLSFYMLKISWVDIKRTKKKLQNDGILL